MKFSAPFTVLILFHKYSKTQFSTFLSMWPCLKKAFPFFKQKFAKYVHVSNFKRYRFWPWHCFGNLLRGNQYRAIVSHLIFRIGSLITALEHGVGLIFPRINGSYLWLRDKFLWLRFLWFWPCFGNLLRGNQYHVIMSNLINKIGSFITALKHGVSLIFLRINGSTYRFRFRFLWFRFFCLLLVTVESKYDLYISVCLLCINNRINNWLERKFDSLYSALKHKECLVLSFYHEKYLCLDSFICLFLY